MGGEVGGKKGERGAEGRLEGNDTAGTDVNRQLQCCFKQSCCSQMQNSYLGSIAKLGHVCICKVRGLAEQADNLCIAKQLQVIFLDVLVRQVHGHVRNAVQESVQICDVP